MAEVNEYIRRLAQISEKNNRIEPEMYLKHDVKRGLRDLEGNGVVAGLTEISVINWKKTLESGEQVKIFDIKILFSFDYILLMRVCLWMFCHKNSTAILIWKYR